MAIVLIVALIMVVLMAVESYISRRHERWLRARGAVEPVDDVYPEMTAAYPASFLAMTMEGVFRGPATPGWLTLGAVLLAAAKLLKYWAIAALGGRWTFRVLVLRGVPLVTSGPYRFMRHPNYLAVIGELLGVAMIMAAPVTGSLALVGFGWLIRRRITVEEQALGRGSSASKGGHDRRHG